MGERGPKSNAPGGYGAITAKGYRRIYDKKNKRYPMEHVVVWEAANGPIPDGHNIHHINHDPIDNRLENLALVDFTTHKRLHNGCELRDGIWWKPCNICGQFKPITKSYWYFSKEGWPQYGRCRPCHIKIVVKDKRIRKALARTKQ